MIHFMKLGNLLNSYMKKILLLYLFSFTISNAQDDSKKLLRTTLIKTFNESFEDTVNNNSESKVNVFSKDDNLCFEKENKLQISQSDYLKDEIYIKNILRNKSRETIISILKGFNVDFLNSINNECDFYFIKFFFYYSTKDYSEIELKFNVNTNSLTEVFNNFNKRDIENIIISLN